MTWGTRALMMSAWSMWGRILGIWLRRLHRVKATRVQALSARARGGDRAALVAQRRARAGRPAAPDAGRRHGIDARDACPPTYLDTLDRAAPYRPGASSGSRSKLLWAQVRTAWESLSESELAPNNYEQ